MLGDPSSLLRVRRLALGEARRALEASLGAEALAEAAARTAERAIEVESDAAHVLTADDGTVEAFAAWLPQARRRVGLAREAVDVAFEQPLETGLREERRLFALAFASDDAREGMDAFVARRAPSWSARP